MTITTAEQIARETDTQEAARLLIGPVKNFVSRIPSMDAIPMEVRLLALLLLRDQVAESLRDPRVN